MSLYVCVGSLVVFDVFRFLVVSCSNSVETSFVVSEWLFSKSSIDGSICLFKMSIDGSLFLFKVSIDVSLFSLLFCNPSIDGLWFEASCN